MAEKRKVANPLALAVLSYLSQRPMHPYELSRMLRDHGDVRSIKFNHGSLYMVVGQLAKAGSHYRAGNHPGGAAPGTHRVRAHRRRPGRVPRAGWASWSRQPQHEYPHFVAALSLIAALPPGEVLTLLHGLLDRLAGQRAEICDLIGAAQAGGLHPLFLVEEDYRLAQAGRRASAFVERFIGQITDPETGWGPMWAQFHGQPFNTGSIDERQQS